MKTSIQPITFWNETATTLVIENANITTFGEGGTVHIQWYVSTNEGKRLKNDVIVLSGNEYSAWGADDNYVLNQIATKLGLTIVVQDHSSTNSNTAAELEISEGI